MKRVPTTSPDRLEYREPCGWWVFITLPLFAAGIAVASFLTFGPDGFAADMLRDNSLIVLLFGGGFLLWMGYWIVTTGVEWFGTVGVSFDRARKTFFPAWGFFLPLFGSSRRLADYNHLQMTMVFTYSRGRVVDSKYCLYLARGADDRVLIGRSGDYAPVRNMADDVGEFLCLDLIDGTGSTPVLLPWETLGKSLKEQAPSEPGQPLPPPPPLKLLRYREEGEQVHLDFPSDGSLGCLAVWLLLVAGLIGFLTYIGIDSQGKAWGAILFYGIIGAFMLAVFYGLAAPSRKSADVDASGLRIFRHGLFLTSQTFIPAQSIRELRQDATGVTVISDKGQHSLGIVSPPEAHWLRAVMLQRLS